MKKNTPVYIQPQPENLKADPDIIRLFDVVAQSYSLLYPTVDRFVEAYDSAAYLASATNRKIGGIRRPLSIYVHFPFCNSICFYCNHAPIVTKNSAGTKKYINFLLREIKLQGHLFQDDPSAEQIYFGGGTPTLLNEGQLRCVTNEIHHYFNLSADGEYSIEIDPRQITSQTMAALKEMGFNAIIIEVLDFDDAVQRAIHRIQPESKTISTIQAAQQEAFQSITTKLIYGLPKQTVKKFDETLKKIILERPDRISLVNYVHLPEKFKPQRKINTADLPPTEVRLEIIQQAINQLSDANYVHIGINHFVKKNDELAIAQQQGRLYHNFQGYSTHMDSDLVGLGVAAIGSIGPTYNQNERDISRYYDKLAQNILPIARGLELTADDLLRRLVMHTLICNSVLLFESIETVFPIDFKDYFATEFVALIEYEKSGLLTLNDEGISITPKGRIFMRNICMVFDKYLRASNERKHQSKII